MVPQVEEQEEIVETLQKANGVQIRLLKSTLSQVLWDFEPT